jgi:hypothetical protein
MTGNQTQTEAPTTEKRLNCALRPDAQRFDEVRIVTVPRYKQSGLSGDEWRISGAIQLYRKGKLIHERHVRNVEMGCVFAAGTLYEAQDDGKGYFAGDGVHCDQEGCADAATVRYRKKADYCREAHKTEPFEPSYRHFCDRHKTRGDCGFDDSDANYVEEPLK